LSSPASPTNDNEPSFSGTGGTADGDSGTVTVNLFQGTGTGGTEVGTAQTATVTSGSWSTPALGTALADGTYTVEAVQTDDAGNSTSKTATFTVDTTAPALAITDGPADGSLTNDASPTFSFTAGNDAATVKCELDSGGFRACSAAGSDALAGLADGRHTWSVEASDEAGNTATASRTFTVDATPPTVTLTSPANGATYTEGKVVDASYSCTDVNLATCAGPVASGAAIDTSTLGKHTFTVTATDAAGNTTSRSATYTVTAPSQAPAVKLTGSVYTQGTSAMVPLACRAAKGQQCVVTVTLTARERLSGKRYRTIVVGSGKHRLSAGEKTTLRIHLSAAGQKLLAKEKRLPVAVSIRVGSKLVATKHVTFAR
jgi:hypothetical protein